MMNRRFLCKIFKLPIVFKRKLLQFVEKSGTMITLFQFGAVEPNLKNHIVYQRRIMNERFFGL